MATERTSIHISPESELSLVLRHAAAARKPVRIDTGDAQYELDVHPTGGPPDADHATRTVAGIRKAAGGWRNLVDAEALTAELYERRRMASRPPVEL